MPYFFFFLESKYQRYIFKRLQTSQFQEVDDAMFSRTLWLVLEIGNIY